MIKVVIKKVGQQPEVKEVEDTLETYQGLVGGYIELFDAGFGIVGICNEEGKLNGMQPNIMHYNDVVCGDVVFVSAKDGDFIGLNDEQIKVIMEIFKNQK